MDKRELYTVRTLMLGRKAVLDLEQVKKSNTKTAQVRKAVHSVSRFERSYRKMEKEKDRIRAEELEKASRAFRSMTNFSVTMLNTIAILAAIADTPS